MSVSPEYYKLKTLHPLAIYVKIAPTLSCYRYSEQRKVGKPHFFSYKELLAGVTRE
jgi:hypothetical protein